MKPGNGNTPAHPCVTNQCGECFATKELDPNMGMPITVVHHPGLTKLEEIASRAMQGLLADPNIGEAVPKGEDPYTAMARWSVKYAKALLEEAQKEI